MYKIYINDLPLIITHPEKRETIPESALVTPFINNTKILLNYVDLLEKQKGNHQGIVLTDVNVEDAFQNFTQLFIRIEAAGGLVKNDENKFLFIYRRKHWDLPKGKIEKGECKKEAAVREVMEETGLKNIRLKGERYTTYHTYLLKGKRIFKPTYWFNMECDNAQTLRPQEEEDIADCRWIAHEDFLYNYSSESYRNIVDVVMCTP